MTTLKDLFNLEGKVAIVTGASSGLGVEFARALATAGANVGLVARRADRLQAVADELTAIGVRALAAPADVCDRAQIARAVEKIAAGLGEIDVLVNNAGVAESEPVESYALDKWQRAIDVNLSAVFHFSQIVGGRMIAAPRAGRIINVTSVFGSVGCGIYRNSGYVATKAGAENLTRQLAIEWARHGITVNAIAPAWFPSEMSEAGLKLGHGERMVRFTPMRRLGEPRELWTAVLFLASPHSSYVTGSVVHVDGGWTAW